MEYVRILALANSWTGDVLALYRHHRMTLTRTFMKSNDAHTHICI